MNASIRCARIALCIGVMVTPEFAATPVLAASTFACVLAGGSQAIVDSCGARWSAANIRVHIAAQTYGGESEACLTKIAAALDALAAKWIANGKSGSAYSLPCGSLPAVASADDGLLARACPTAAWSYANRGEPKCDTSIPHMRERLAKTGTVLAQINAPLIPPGPSMANPQDRSTIADPVQLSCTMYFLGAGGRRHFQLVVDVPNGRLKQIDDDGFASGWISAKISEVTISWNDGIGLGVQQTLQRDTLELETDFAQSNPNDVSTHGSCSKTQNQI